MHIGAHRCAHSNSWHPSATSLLELEGTLASLCNCADTLVQRSVVQLAMQHAIPHGAMGLPTHLLAMQYLCGSKSSSKRGFATVRPKAVDDPHQE